MVVFRMSLLSVSPSVRGLPSRGLSLSHSHSHSLSCPMHLCTPGPLKQYALCSTLIIFLFNANFVLATLFYTPPFGGRPQGARSSTFLIIADQTPSKNKSGKRNQNGRRSARGTENTTSRALRRQEN